MQSEPHASPEPIDDPPPPETSETAEEGTEPADAPEPDASAADGESEAPVTGEDVSPPVPDNPSETSVTCPQCNTGAKWKGPITDDMRARTFTRGVSDETGLPNCPRCGTPMQLRTEPTAVEQAAEQLAGEPGKVEAPRAPKQASIPGLRPPFDANAALERIFEQRAAVRSAEAYAETKHKDASRAKKHAEELQEELSKLEDEYAERYEELQREANLTPEARADRNAAGCQYERETGKPCGICRAPDATRNPGNVTPSHAASAAIVANNAEALDAADLCALVTAIARQTISPADVVEWTREDKTTVLAWLERKANDNAIAAASGEATDTTSSSRPTVLGRPHTMNDLGTQCRECGEHIPGTWTPNQLVGVDCEGKAERETARTPKPRHATTKARQSAKQKAAKSGDTTRKAGKSKTVPKKKR